MRLYDANGKRGFKVSQELQEMIRSGFIDDRLMKPARRVISKIQDANQRGEYSIPLTDDEAQAVMEVALEYGEWVTAAPLDRSFVFAGPQGESIPRTMSSVPERQPSYRSYPIEELE